MKILVCDDDEIIVSSLIEKIKEFTPDDINPVITGLTHSKDILESVQKNSYDIAFLDIELKDLNGIQVGTMIQKKYPYAIIIFISSYQQYVSDAFSIQAFQYLYKPINDEQLKREYQKAIHIYKRVKMTYVFHTIEGKKMLQPRDIMYVETYYRRINIVTRHDVYPCSIKQRRNIIEILKHFDFVQVHQSFYVNMHHIYVIHQDHLILYSRNQLPLSPRKRKEVMKKFTLFLSRQAFRNYPNYK